MIFHSGHVQRWGVQRFHYSVYVHVDGEGGEGSLERVPPRLGGGGAVEPELEMQ